jgi:hypothetical protein
MADDGGGASRTTDPAAGSSAATDVSLREYLMAQINAVESRANLRFEAMKAQVEAAFASSQRAIDKADEATEKRFEGVNEFRAALSDQATRFVTTETLASLGDKLEASIDRNREDLNTLATRIDLRQGQDVGSKLTWGSVMAVIAAIGTIVGILVVTATYLTTH